MDWSQILTVFAVIATNLGTVITLYCQTDCKIDRYRIETDQKIDRYRIETDQKIDEHRRETNSILNAIREDMRDFHGRLCSIEEKNRLK